MQQVLALAELDERRAGPHSLSTKSASHARGAILHANELFDELKSQHGFKADSDLAKLIGLTPGRISQMRKREHTITLRQVVSYLSKAEDRGRRLAIENIIRPIVEMYPIVATSSKHDKKKEVLPTPKSNTRNVQIRSFLSKAQGIYILYDSLGCAIYVGKTETQGIWKELNNAFNRERSNHQAVFVSHPTTGTRFKPTWEAPRQPKNKQVFLFDTAHYFSAYEVTTEVIGDLEALLVRAFANNLSNKKMEKFSSFRRKVGG